MNSTAGLICCVVTIAALTAFGQGTTGGIDLAVTDASGAAVPGASVTATSLASGADYKAETDSTGHCQFLLLRPGIYRVTVEHSGFKKLSREDLVVSATNVVHLDLEIALGTVTESVTVAAQTPLLQSVDATIGQVVEQNQITSIPLASRNFTQLLATSAGISGTVFNADNPGNGSTNVSVNGARPGNNSLQLDGAPGDSAQNKTAQNEATPSLEFLSEFRVLSHNFDAEYGRNLGGVVSATTRSGSNSFHGAAYEFLRNTDLNARPFFNVKSGENIQNQFGANLGGPIRRDKTFFFVGWEMSRQLNANSGSSIESLVVPTVDQRAGNFGSIKITDPLTGQPFPNNVIPTSRISTIAVNIQNKFIPLPNYSSGGATNFFATQPFTTFVNEYMVRIDHRIGDSDLLWGRLFQSRERDFSPFGYGLIGFPKVTGAPKVTAAVSYTHVFTPTLVLESSIAGNSSLADNKYGNLTPMTSVGLQPLPSTVQTQGMPYIGISSYESFGNHDFSSDWTSTYTLRADMTYTRGRHTLKTGFELRSALTDHLAGGTNPGSFSFTGTATGKSYADYLLGFTANKNFSAGPGETVFRDWDLGVYVNDNWRITSNVTITMGLRYEPYWQPATYNLQSTNWWPDKYTGIGSLAASGIVQGGVNGVPNATVYNDMNNFMPRLGVAWRLGKDWVIRTGAGLYFDTRMIQVAQQVNGNTPAFAQVTVDCTAAGSSCSLKSPDNFTFVDPGYNPKTILYPTSPTQGVEYNSTERNTKTDNAWQWSFTIQRQLPRNTLIEAAYIGTKGTHLQDQFMGDPLVPAGFNPADPKPGPLTRRYPGFGNNQMNGQGASSSYNAFQLTLKERVAFGTVQAAYTRSKTISDAGDNTGRPYSTLALAPWWDWSRAFGPADFDRPNRLSVMFTQDLPKFRLHGLGERLLNNWSANGLFIAQSGDPLSVTNTSSGGGLGGAASSTSAALYSNVVSGVPPVTAGPNDSKLNNYINLAAWSKAPTGTVGNSGRGMFRGPGQFDLDFSLFKVFPIREHAKLEFRSEFFNILNHPNFGDPNTSMDSASFGQISTTTVNARVLQFALKLMF